MDYELQEGGIALPAGFEDRTVNMFVLGASVPAPLSITISRDTLLPDEALQAYVDRQVKLLTSKLRGYTRMGNKAVTLSVTAPIAGIQIDLLHHCTGRLQCPAEPGLGQPVGQLHPACPVRNQRRVRRTGVTPHVRSGQVRRRDIAHQRAGGLPDRSVWK